MRDAIIDHLVARGVATGEQAEQARALLALGDSGLVSLLCEVGFPESEVLAAASAVTRLPAAPVDLLEKPKTAGMSGLDLDVFRGLGAAPFAVHQGALCVAFKEPETALSDAARQLPTHRPFLALAAHVDGALATLSGASSPVRARTPAPARTPTPAPSSPVGVSLASMFRSPAEDDGYNESGVYRVQAREELPDPAARRQTPAPMPAVADPPAPLQMDASELGLVPIEQDTEAKTIAVAALPDPAAHDEAKTVAVAALLDPAAHDEAKTVAVPALSVFDDGETDVEPVGLPPGTERLSAPRPFVDAPFSDDAARTVESEAPGAPSPRPTYEEAPTTAVAQPDELLRMAAAERVDDDDDASSLLDLPAPAPFDLPAPSPFDPPSTSPFGPSPSPFGAASAAPMPSMADIFGQPTAAPAPGPTEPPPLEVPAPAPIQEPPARSSPPPPVTPLDTARQSLVSGIERYRTIKVLGRGGMATVYLADDAQTGEQVALKIMEPHLAEDPTFIERFRREMKTSASLAHENIVRVSDCGESGGNLYMAAEFVDAGTLKELLQKMGRVPGPVVAEILYQSLLGLAHAHDKNLVHRDLKPANLMLTSGGVVKVGDFGIAKSNTDNTITQTGMLFGTPAYMSPEQAFGRDLDGRSDLFSVGTVCYELLTGRNPYNHENMSTCLIMISKATARHVFEQCPTLPPLLEHVLTKMMRRDPNDRYPTAHDAARELEPLVTTLRERFGNLLEKALRDPAEVKLLLGREQAELEVIRAEALLARDPEAHRQQVAFRYFKAATLDPTNTFAAERFASLSEEHGFRFEITADEALKELESALEKKPDSVALLRRGADLCAAKKNLLGAAAWMKRYLLIQPNDLHMARLLAAIVGDDPLAPWRPLEDPQHTPATLPPPVAGSLTPSGGIPMVQENPESATWPVARAPGPDLEESVPTGIVEDVSGVLMDGTSRVRALVDQHRGRLMAAGIALSVLLVLAVGLRVLFGVLDPRAGGETQAAAPAAAAVAPLPSLAEKAAPSVKPPEPEPEPEVAAVAVAPKKDEASGWLEERAQQQRERFEQGKKKLALGDSNGALEDFNAAIILDAGSDLALDIRLARGKAYADAGRHEDARSDLERVTERLAKSDPRSVEARRLLDGLPKQARKRVKTKKRGEPAFQVGAFEQALEEAQRDDGEEP